MVLSPFIFLSTRPALPTLQPQPTEVASTHWVSLRALLSPSLRTTELVDVSDRFVKQGGPLVRLACRSTIGWMQFSAIHLIPTESLQCNSVPGFIPSAERSPASSSLLQKWTAWTSRGQLAHRNRPLLLWGLTLGILADFLDMLPPHTAVQLWGYPTFTAPDLQLIVKCLTYHLRRRNLVTARSSLRSNQTAVDSQTAALPVAKETDVDGRSDVGIGGLGVGGYREAASPRGSEGSFYAVGILMKGYYDRLRIAIAVFLAWRAAAGSIAVFYAFRFLRNRALG